MEKKYRDLAGKIGARLNCASGNEKWFDKHTEDIEAFERDILPFGSGISGCKIDLEKSTNEKIVINSEYHTMNEHGYYGRWIYFTVTVTGSLQFGVDLRIKGNFGKDQDLKEYLYEVFSCYSRRVLKHGHVSFFGDV